MNNYDSNSFLPSDCSDCIFISGLPKSIQKDEIISTFSQVGKIKVAKGSFQFRGRPISEVPVLMHRLDVPKTHFFRSSKNFPLFGSKNKRPNRRCNSYLSITRKCQKSNWPIWSNWFQWTWNDHCKTSFTWPKKSLCWNVGKWSIFWKFGIF